MADINVRRLKGKAVTLTYCEGYPWKEMMGILAGPHWEHEIAPDDWQYVVAKRAHKKLLDAASKKRPRRCEGVSRESTPSTLRYAKHRTSEVPADAADGTIFAYSLAGTALYRLGPIQMVLRTASRVARRTCARCDGYHGNSTVTAETNRHRNSLLCSASERDCIGELPLSASR